MICMCCTGKTIEENIKNIEVYRKYLDMVELRLDFLDPLELDKISGFPELTALPCILSYRRPEDGGAAAEIDELRRFEILMSGLSGGFAYIDIEDDTDIEYSVPLIEAAQTAGTAVIRSFHDFTKVPDNLYERMIEASDGGRFIPKAAVLPKGTSDLLKIVETARRLTGVEDGKEASVAKFILLGMGVFGFPSRVLSRSLGSMLTFTSPAGTSAAPGHVDPAAMVDVFGFNRSSRDCRVYGIVGNPVMHSKSPQIHNGGYRDAGIEAVYVPFETSEPELLMKNADLLNLGGLSVTIPHKQRVIPFATRVDDSVRAIGACNTLVNRGGDLGWEAFNTDYIGFLDPLRGIHLAGKNALVIGAGGAARAVVYALVKSGMNVSIINRTAETAVKLASDFGCRGGGLDDAGNIGTAFLVVQTTSVGMSPDLDGNPLPNFDFTGNAIVYDLIYTPEKTAFLRRAEDAGCRVINGYRMLTAQAAEQFLLFTGCKANF